MADTHTVLLRGSITVADVREFVATLGDLDVTVTVHADRPDYDDDLGLPLSQYAIEVSIVGDPPSELKVGRVIHERFPDSLLLANMQRVIV